MDSLRKELMPVAAPRLPRETRRAANEGLAALHSHGAATPLLPFVTRSLETIRTGSKGRRGHEMRKTALSRCRPRWSRALPQSQTERVTQTSSRRTNTRLRSQTTIDDSRRDSEVGRVEDDAGDRANRSRMSTRRLRYDEATPRAHLARSLPRALLPEGS